MKGTTMESNNQRYLQLGDVIDEVSSHIELLPARIREHYSDEFDPPGSYPPWNEDPSQQMVEQAAHLIEYEFGLWENRTAIILDGDIAWRRSYFIHLAVASELLLNAFYMDNEPLEYADKLENKRTPNLDSGKNYFLSNVELDLSNEQRKRITRVIDLIRIKRNNYVHAGLHDYGHVNIRAPIYEVLHFLFTHISQKELDVIQMLTDEAARERDVPEAGVTTKKIEFPVG